MFTRTWSTSERKYEVTVERDVKVRMPDGTALDGDIYRPASSGRFPVILGAHAYNKDLQSPPMRPVGFTPMRGYMESGDSTFFARRGYVHAVFNVRGTGKSEGFYQLMGPVEVQDICDLTDWLAAQPWSTGNTGMFGVSYFARLAKAVAAASPKSLKAIFAPFAGTDDYRHRCYHGGILAHGFLTHWRNSLHRPRYRSIYKEMNGEEAFRQAIDRAMRDEEIMTVPPLREALQNPEVGTNALVVDVLLHPFDGPFWHARNAHDAKAMVPAYLGACWGNYGLHLPGAFTAWKDWKGPKKMVIGPPIYLDRPLYQYQHESLRWFDYWLKGINNSVMEEPPIRCFIPPTGEWKSLADWPPPETRWMTFYLHKDGVLSEHELWPGESVDSFDESNFEHGAVTYATPALVENTEILGPSVLTLYLSTTDTEALLFVTLLLVDRSGNEHELTRGWLRASQRRPRDDSEPWEPMLAHEEREPLEPGKIYELRIPIVPTARLFQAGERIAIRIKGADDEPPLNSLQALARNHLRRPRPARITIYHDESHPSHVDLPITRGNLIGTFFSGGDISSFGLSR
ncbi:MAG: CocE/NonD family hydrolase [Deltaproteobacteria bacterium]|nr:MAG: CocE/NonD family hydrolase [Deltaproteobacteria bacterium]